MDEINNNERRSVTGIDLIARSSVFSIRSQSTSSSSDGEETREFSNALWKFTFLRERFKRKNLESLFKKYQKRIMHVNVKNFLILQTILSGIVMASLLIANREYGFADIIPEVIGHGILILACPVLFTYFFNENTVKNDAKPHLFLAVFLSVLLTGTNLVSPLQAAFTNNSTQNETFEELITFPSGYYSIIVVYNLLPISSIWLSIFFGTSIGILHVTTTVLLFRSVLTELRISNLLIAEAVFYIIANILGIYSKLLNEITLRRAFLDRRSCIESTLKHEYEKGQEERLMLSILPKHIASEVSKDLRDSYEMIVKEMENRNQNLTAQQKPFSKLYVENHRDVSILYADIVNFTPLTVTLSVGDLVEMLNELFEKFDEAAEKNNCLRIKILGDCYYCVSGIAVSSTSSEGKKEHAKNCVEMGLSMIDVIRDIRQDRCVNVDMRIGVHTGNVVCGLLGILKWQFDIWSRDVTIANHMEQAGKPGRVHVSLATKEQLGDLYGYEPGYGERDPYLAEQRITTFLIVPRRKLQIDSPNGFEDRVGIMKPTSAVTSDLKSRGALVEEESDPEDLYLVMPTPLPVEGVNNNSKTVKYSSFQIGASITASHFTKTHKQSLAASPVDDNFGDNRLKPRKSSTNKNGILGKKASGPSRRRSTLTEPVRRGAVLMDSSLDSYRQIMETADSRMVEAIETLPLNNSRKKGQQENTKVNAFLFFRDRKWELPFLKKPDLLFRYYPLGALIIGAGIGVIQGILGFQIFHWFWTSYGIVMGIIFSTVLVIWACYVSGIIARQEMPALSRKVAIYSGRISRWFERLTARISVFLLITVSTAFIFIVDMAAVINYECKDSQTLPNCLSEDETISYTHLYYIWLLTCKGALALTVGFVFYHISFLLKLIYYVAIITAFIAVFFISYGNIWQDGRRSYFLEQAPNHIGNLVGIAFVLHITDRMIEFVERMDYVWQRQLTEEKEEANRKKVVNKLLLENILPLHVAKFYLDVNRSSNKLYHEEYQSVTVMFASIPNYTDFPVGENDDGIAQLTTLNTIIAELDLLILSSEEFRQIEKIKLIGSTYMAACGLAPGRSDSDEEEEFTGNHYLVTMVRFASAMNRVLRQINGLDQNEFQLRLGIDCGPVIAGVVGAQKPLYDIWGDTVNMASRMNYTGEPGKIQVTEKTANLLFQEGIECELRGKTFVKGKGLVTTYWVLPGDDSKAP